MKNLNLLAAEIHKENHHWWHDADGKPLKRNRDELLMLVITELSEAVEGIRKDLMDDHLPHRLMEEVEMADAVIRLLDFAAGFNINVDERPISGAYLLGTNKAGHILQIVTLVTCVRSFSHARGDDYVGATIAAIQWYCQRHKLDLWGAVKEKAGYNRDRADHKHENRAKAGGKKF